MLRGFYAKAIAIMLNSVSMMLYPSRGLDGDGAFGTKHIQQEIDDDFNSGGWVIPGIVKDNR